MKVVYKYPNRGYAKNLTIGNSYDIIEREFSHIDNYHHVHREYLIVNDIGVKEWYNEHLFESIENNRNSKIDIICRK